jgi:uncharacterized protein Veg
MEVDIKRNKTKGEGVELKEIGGRREEEDRRGSLATFRFRAN